MLLIYGSTDIQVDARDGELVNSSNEAAGLQVIDGMNHVLKTVKRIMKAQLILMSAK